MFTCSRRRFFRGFYNFEKHIAPQCSYNATKFALVFKLPKNDYITPIMFNCLDQFQYHIADNTTPTTILLQYTNIAIQLHKCSFHTNNLHMKPTALTNASMRQCPKVYFCPILHQCCAHVSVVAVLILSRPMYLNNYYITDQSRNNLCQEGFSSSPFVTNVIAK